MAASNRGNDFIGVSALNLNELSALISPTAVTLHHGGHDKAARYHFAAGRVEDAFLNQWEGNSFKDTDLISSHCVSML